MKNIASSILLLICLPLSIHGKPQALEFGIKLGSTSSHIDITVEKKKEEPYKSFPRRPVENIKKPEEKFQINSTKRYHVGIFFRHPSYEYMHIEWEILYTGKGGKAKPKELIIFKPEDTTLFKSLTITLDYILTAMNITVFPYRANKSYVKNLFFVGGSYIAYMLAANQKQIFKARSGEKIIINENLLHNSSNSDLRKVDLGFTIGAGYEFDLGIILGFTFDVGLIKLLKGLRGTNVSSHLSIGYNLSKLYNST